MNSLKHIPYHDQMILKGDDRIAAYSSDIVMKGDPDAVFRPGNIKELKEIFVYCHRSHIPITICGNQTSLTGSSVAENGLLLSTEKLNKIIDIDLTSSEPIAISEPGIFLAEFQDTLLSQGSHYPPDPTSRKEARLGSTIATNATGEDSLLYGSTRCYVRSLKVLLADGSELFLRRTKKDSPQKGKNIGGYFLDGIDPIDLFIGSEGTLGFITEITVDLLLDPPEYFSGIIFFPDIYSALRCAVKTMSSKSIKPRCLELIDDSGLTIINKKQESFFIPPSAKAALYFKQEFHNKTHQDNLMNDWLQHLSLALKESSTEFLLEYTIIASTRKEQEVLRDLRHSIPATINELAQTHLSFGGGKVSTDWWVPINHIEQAMNMALTDSLNAKLTPYIFGHIGNGHPHLNYIVKNNDEKSKALKIITEQCRRAASWGGGVAGEHGIGKIKKFLLNLQYPQKIINKMIAVKKQFDPHWILGRNNLFYYE